MPAGRFDFICEKGATFSYSLTWKDEGGSAVNLAGYSARMHVRTSYEDPEAAVILTTDNSGISITANTGRLALSLSPSVTESIPSFNPSGTPPTSNYVYDLELVAPNGTITRLLQGRFRVVEEVTR